ncbi:MAG: 50S ribosomal protein L16 [bacterium]|nr:50S ribosomal protein L16 [candidate division WOR-3 bacterium]MDH5683523.1 50S ribosomal protein L16 [candidate division WOR-3 bacterium]
MLMPKRVKYRKQQRGRRKGKATAANKLDFGEFGLQALEPVWVTGRQIEASRVAITKFMKKAGKLWIRIFPDKPISKKPAETRMGTGKGAPEFWVSVVKPGRILFEVDGIGETDSRAALRLAASKLPCRTRVIKRGEIGYEAF